VAKAATGVGEWDTHVVSVRLRIQGNGNFQQLLTDYDNVQTQNLVDLPMQALNRFEPTRLANFQSQRIRMVGGVTEIDEWFDIHRIIIFAKPVAIEYPSGTGG